MISLKTLREFYEAVVADVPGLSEAVAISVESNLADVVRHYGDRGPVLFFLPPSGQTSGGDIDSIRDTSACVLFVMQKYDPRRARSVEVLEEVQPVVELVKRRILEEPLRRPCSVIRARHSEVSTLPETEFFGNWAGWSLAFKLD